ncbi:hypothetical protein TIFTF001_017746 [Ficus carica]|uniref:Uncharacterized protein n=1 Tax=Ficus carica TaxID=3494 RepID=A0AA88D798_FICCA|nr:hypothetical protein TIFTF001_017746 [Ficus carica]
MVLLFLRPSPPELGSQNERKNGSSNFLSSPSLFCPIMGKHYSSRDLPADVENWSPQKERRQVGIQPRRRELLEKESRWRSEKESCWRKKVDGERESPAPKSRRAWATPSQAAHHQSPPRTHCRRAVETAITSSTVSTITMSSGEIL